jgi:hypothetical protein
MMKCILCLTFCTLIFFSCKEDEPKNLLPPKKMVEVLTDIMTIEVYSKNYIEKDSTKKVVLENAKMQMQVFALHKVSKDDFYKSYNYYMTNSTKTQSIFDSIISNINNDKVRQYVRPIIDTANKIGQ